MRGFNVTIRAILEPGRLLGGDLGAGGHSGAASEHMGRVCNCGLKHRRIACFQPHDTGRIRPHA